MKINRNSSKKSLVRSLTGYIGVEPYIRGSYLIALNATPLIDLLFVYSGRETEIVLSEERRKKGSIELSMVQFATFKGIFLARVDKAIKIPEEFFSIGNYDLLKIFETYISKKVSIDIYQ